jgi:hypothetical protein
MTREKQSKPKQRKNFLLSDSTMGLLARMDNASGYVDRLVQARQQRAMQSLLHLQGLGWTGPEILACCDALNGAMSFCAAPRWHGASLFDGPEYASKWGVTPERWAEIARQVSESESVAYAIHEVVSEFWCGNTVIDAALRKGADRE